MWHWLRRSFLTGFFVIVPLLVSVAALVYFFRLVDGLMSPVYARWLFAWLGRPVPGLGLLTTLALVLVVGAVATNVIGKRLLQRARALPDAGAGLQDDLRAGQAAGRRLLPGQRVRLQARRAGGRGLRRRRCSGS